MAVGSFALVVASVFATKANNKKFAAFTGTIYYGTAGSSSATALIKACSTDALITTNNSDTKITFPGTNQVLRGFNGLSFYTLYY
jgi:hypothetical protein